MPYKYAHWPVNSYTNLSIVFQLPPDSSNLDAFTRSLVPIERAIIWFHRTRTYDRIISTYMLTIVNGTRNHIVIIQRSFRKMKKHSRIQSYIMCSRTALIYCLLTWTKIQWYGMRFGRINYCLIQYSVC